LGGQANRPFKALRIQKGTQHFALRLGYADWVGEGETRLPHGTDGFAACNLTAGATKPAPALPTCATGMALIVEDSQEMKFRGANTTLGVQHSLEKDSNPGLHLPLTGRPRKSELSFIRLQGRQFVGPSRVCGLHLIRRGARFSRHPLISVQLAGLPGMNSCTRTPVCRVCYTFVPDIRPSTSQAADLSQCGEKLRLDVGVPVQNDLPCAAHHIKVIAPASTGLDTLACL
jgi:hypothetical protein